MNRLLVLLTFIPASMVYAQQPSEYFLQVGVEHFTWAEFDQGERLLDETGSRYFVALDAEATIDQFWKSGFFAKLYGGGVEYDGQLTNGAAHSSDTDYDGWSVEFDFRRALTMETIREANKGWWLRFGLGYDLWRRNLLGASGYIEEYRIVFGRLGVIHDSNRWRLQAGLKYPFNNSEEVGLSKFGFDEDPRLSPQGSFSLYGQLKYRLSSRWGLGLYYDSYRFKESDEEPLRVNGVVTRYVYQPESHQDTIGLAIEYQL